jgi:hypothetical protein
MSTLHLTEIAVRALKTSGTYYDTSTPAFGLRVGKRRKTSENMVCDPRKSKTADYRPRAQSCRATCLASATPFETEALPEAPPIGRNSPQKIKSRRRPGYREAQE